MVRRYFCKELVSLHEKQLTILVYLASLKEWEIISQTKIALQWNMPISSLNYHFTKLKHRGLITKQNQLTEKGKILLRHFKHWDKSFDRKFRAHNVQITFNIVKPPHDFDKIRTTIMQPFSNGRYHGGKTEVLGCTVLFYSQKKAVVKLPPIFGDTSEEIAAAILDLVGQLKEALESEFPGFI